MLAQILIELSTMRQWFDDCLPDYYKASQHATELLRLAKIGEELGEAMQAYVVSTGGNPRKPATDNDADVLSELADVVVTTIIAMLTIHNDESVVGAAIVDKVQSVGRRIAQAKRQQHLEALRDGQLSQEAQRAFKHSLGLP